MINPDAALSREQILQALAKLNDALAFHQATGELCLFGGAVMVLVFNARLSTRDVDAIFQPTSLLRDLAKKVAEEMNLPEDWLNDAVKGFQSSQPEWTREGLPEFPHLRIFRPTTPYLLAMKCMAARAPGLEGRGDREDITALIAELKLRHPEEVMKIVTLFFPEERILPKTRFMIEEIIPPSSRS